MRHQNFEKHILEWYQEEGREFFWREIELNPFQVLVLEILLRRTRAETVDEYGRNIVGRYDTPSEVIEAGKEKLESEIGKLGYVSRAEDLLRISREIEDKGKLPDNRDELMEIEGIGQYIADAILCYGYGQPRVPLDMNVARVGKYYLDISIPSDLRYADELKEEMEERIPEDEPEVFNWALQDLGSALKSNGDPLGLE
ncbi:MAG: endonuclease III domain-containing protein [Candidatus Aenigmatarchaeota archaeon]